MRAWTEAQNRLARSYLDALPGRAALAKRYGELLHIETITAPSRAGDRVFYMKRHADQEKAVLYWKSAVDSNDTDHVLIDPNLYVGTNNASLGSTAVTLDGTKIAYTLRPNNADEATLYVRDVATGADLPGEVIEGAKYADRVMDARRLRLRLHLPASRRAGQGGRPTRPGRGPMAQAGHRPQEQTR